MVLPFIISGLQSDETYRNDCLASQESTLIKLGMSFGNLVD